MKYTYDDEADARTTALIRVMALFFVGIMIIAATTSPISTGTKEGERAPALEGKSYNGSGWSDFNLESYWDPMWEEGDITGQWVAIEFMDTDCPYCFNDAAQKISQFAYDFGGSNAEWDGAMVNFIASVAELNIDGHDSSRSEIIAFRNKIADSGETCNQQDCGSRQGSAHNFPYIDDLDLDNMKKWKVSGTPSYYLIQPDGIIAWSSVENQGESLSDAILTLVPRESA
tara:strand:+ start:465 stop:1151 length:687 start_codon:yes stop_codon:yes gene_type:complete